MPSVEENQAELERRLMEKWHRLPSMIPASSVSQEGREDVLKFISSIILFGRRNADAKAASGGSASRRGKRRNRRSTVNVAEEPRVNLTS